MLVTDIVLIRSTFFWESISWASSSFPIFLAKSSYVNMMVHWWWQQEKIKLDAFYCWKVGLVLLVFFEPPILRDYKQQHYSVSYKNLYNFMKARCSDLFLNLSQILFLFCSCFCRCHSVKEKGRLFGGEYYPAYLFYYYFTIIALRQLKCH